MSIRRKKFEFLSATGNIHVKPSTALVFEKQQPSGAQNFKFIIILISI